LGFKKNLVLTFHVQLDGRPEDVVLEVVGLAGQLGVHVVTAQAFQRHHGACKGATLECRLPNLPTVKMPTSKLSA
jgi:hypothetical protein